jgi:hypothetical protein
MPNSDNLYGTSNKRTKIISQIDDGLTPLTVFADTDEAKSHFFHDEALAVMNECCTQLEWAIVDTNKLKFTYAFGTKGGNIAAAADWAGQYNSRKTALISSNNWMKTGNSADSSDHLF